MDKLTSFPEFPELEFEEENHIYRLNGIIIPSVSNILEPLSRAKYSRVDERTLDRAAERGTSVHDSIENFIKYGIVDVNPEYRGYFNGFHEWWENKKPIFIGSENRIYHKQMRYGGTLDLLVYIGDSLALVDFKTCYAKDDNSWKLQLMGYEYALMSHGIFIDEKMVLHLKKDGKCSEYQYPVKDGKELDDFNAFVKVYRRTNTK